MAIDPIQMMGAGNINPIQMMRFGNFEQQGGPIRTNVSDTGFSEVFKNTWDATSATQQDLVQKQYLQSIGEINDTHTLPIAESKAELALSLLVNLRNKALDSYNELMRISI